LKKYRKNAQPLCKDIIILLEKYVKIVDLTNAFSLIVFSFNMIRHSTKYIANIIL